ncbi:hypothetical protein NIES4101_89240 [Calothrix sp. NIES-4101]|nr:hypothetical protein NIES4101_89240 [Calothrix sp. NIES-4101]
MDITNCDRAAIRLIIEQQLQAFQEDNADAAFVCASPQIQEKFPTAEIFILMVKRAYAPIYRPRSVLFEDITTIQGNITQLVLLLGQDGIPVRALYLMEKETNSSWKINGCFLVPVSADIRFA